MREGVGTEVGKAQLHNLCSQRRTSRFKKQKNLVFPGYCYSQKLYANAFYLNGFFSLLSLLKMRLQLTLHTVKNLEKSYIKYDVLSAIPHNNMRLCVSCSAEVFLGIICSSPSWCYFSDYGHI